MLLPLTLGILCLWRGLSWDHGDARSLCSVAGEARGIHVELIVWPRLAVILINPAQHIGYEMSKRQHCRVGLEAHGDRILHLSKEEVHHTKLLSAKESCKNPLLK